jgi:type II secretory pathway pseudopilin PulG
MQMRMVAAPDFPTRPGESGFTYLGVLFFIAIMSAALAAVADVWSTHSKREKEAELLFIGNQFRDAIKSYARNTPGAAQLPKTLDELIEDKRFPNLRRHLRRIYVDPMTRKAEWGLVQVPGGGIVGVYSLSEDRPLKTAGFSAAAAGFADAKTYGDWKFVVDTALPPEQPAGGIVGTTAMPGAATAPALSPETAAVQPVVPTPGVEIVADDADARRKAREFFCQNQRRSDMATCRTAAQARGPLVGERCTSSIDRRYLACLDPGTQGIVPLDMNPN